MKEIINCFKLSDKIQHLADKERLLLNIQMFTSPDINLSTEERENSEGRTLAPLTNLGMGYVFENSYVSLTRKITKRRRAFYSP